MDPLFKCNNCNKKEQGEDAQYSLLSFYCSECQRELFAGVDAERVEFSLMVAAYNQILELCDGMKKDLEALIKKSLTSANAQDLSPMVSSRCNDSPFACCIAGNGQCVFCGKDFKED